MVVVVVVVARVVVADLSLVFVGAVVGAKVVLVVVASSLSKGAAAAKGIIAIRRNAISILVFHVLMHADSGLFIRDDNIRKGLKKTRQNPPIQQNHRNF